MGVAGGQKLSSRSLPDAQSGAQDALASMTTAADMPSSFALSVLSRVATFRDRESFRNALDILGSSPPSSHAGLKSQMISMTAQMREVRPSTRDVLMLVRVACRLHEIDELQSASLDLLLAGLEALEATPAPHAGPQRRSKRSALAAGYGCASRLPIRFSDLERKLSEASKVVHSWPNMIVVILGVISFRFKELAAAEQRLFLVTAVTTSMEAGREIADSVIRVCGTALRLATVADPAHDVASVIERSLLRDPRKAMPVAECLFLTLRMDLSAVARNRFSPIVLQALQSSEDGTRARSVRLFAAIGVCVRDSAAAAEYISSICTFLSTARYSYQRISAAEAVAAVVSARLKQEGDVGCSLGLRAALQGTLAWLKERERTQKARMAGIRSVVRITSRVADVDANCSALERILQECSEFLSHVLKGNSDTDRHSLLLAMTEGSCAYLLPLSFFGEGMELKLRALVLESKLKPCDCLRALAILCHWMRYGMDSQQGYGADLWNQLQDTTIRSLLFDIGPCISFDDVMCTLCCCEWLVRCNHRTADAALAVVLQFCVDGRSDVSRLALGYVTKFRHSGKKDITARLVMILWNTQLCRHPGGSFVTRSQNFDGGLRAAERLGRTLLSVVMPCTPSHAFPFIAMAANHPKLLAKASRGCVRPKSRFWKIIERSLRLRGTSTSMNGSRDWLHGCLNVILGPLGLQSADPVVVCAAANTLVALADDDKSYSSHVLLRVVAELHPIALAIDGLQQKEDCFGTALQMEVGKRGRPTDRRPNVAETSLEGKKQRSVSTRDGATGLGTEMKEIGRNALVFESNADECVLTAAAGANGVRYPFHSLRMPVTALGVICMLCYAAPDGMHRVTRQALSLILSCASKSEALERVCREALAALTGICGPRLRHFATELSGGLFDVARNPSDISGNMKEIIYRLSTVVPPALGPEDFAVVTPVLKAVMQSQEGFGKPFTLQKAGRSTAQRDHLVVVKGATEVLLEHCKPSTVGSALTAAATGAGYWLVQVLEREDGSFPVAAETLAFLAGTSLRPGVGHLSQVLTALVSGKASVRDAGLNALLRIPQLSSPLQCTRDTALGRALWLARHDEDEANAELADVLWGNYNHALDGETDVIWMIDQLSHSQRDVRVMAAKATAAALPGRKNEKVRKAAIPKMFVMYAQNKPRTGPNGNPRSCAAGSRRRKSEVGQEPEVTDDGWHVREGIALAIEQLAAAETLEADDVSSIFTFLVGHCLGDMNENVRGRMSKAAVAVVKAIGPNGPKLLLPMIENELSAVLTPVSSKDEVLSSDRTRENLVMCLGCVAGFLPETDSRVSKIADRVIHCALETPSEAVQNAAARCLLALAQTAIAVGKEAEVTEYLLNTVWNENATYGRRRGAAYALAGISTGLGLKYFRRCGLITRIRVELGCKSAFRRQGAFLLIETSGNIMGRCFEPYTVAVLPFLLSCMGDPVVEVRNACRAAARSAMSEVSSHCVKKVVPTLIAGLRDRQWRTKAGSADVLGAMTFCAPRQLAECLPQVVPVLAETLADAHPRVVASAESAINRILAVVRNPQVQQLSPFLLAALRDPAGRTSGAVDAMLESEFVHAIDAPSLALLIPPLYRGLRDRSSTLKKRSAAIVGSMCDNVTNPRYVVPYLGFLLPALRSTLLDANPDVRRTSARALGSLARALGEDGLPGLIPWLMNSLLGAGYSTTFSAPAAQGVGNGVVLTSVERSGAATGLAEIACSMDNDRLEDIFVKVLAAGEASSDAREGGLLLIAQMSRTMGPRLEGKLATFLSAVLRGLADDVDAVRESALEAGRSIVAAYARTSLNQLLPELLSAVRESFWRIRLAATHLLGDMLSLIAASPAKAQTLDGSVVSDDKIPLSCVASFGDEIRSVAEASAPSQSDLQQGYQLWEQPAFAKATEETMQAIEKALGTHCRNEVFAALYIVRCDTSIRVRQTGIQVWKGLVVNTPRVLREILPRVVGQVVEGLGDENEERRAVVGRALGDLSQKLGDRVLPEVLPALQNSIMKKNGSVREREGACEGLGELVRASSREYLDKHAVALAEIVYQGLYDVCASVRVTSAEVFGTLLQSLGTTFADAVVPRLLQFLSSAAEGEGDYAVALDALKQILAVSGQALMRSVVTVLLRDEPLSASSAGMLAAAASVGEIAFGPYVREASEAIINSIEAGQSSIPMARFEEVVETIASCGDYSFDTLLERVLSNFSDSRPQRRMAASRTCGVLCRTAPLTRVSRVAGTILEALGAQLVDADWQSAHCAWAALRDLSERVPSSVLSSHIPLVRQSMRSAATRVSGDVGSMEIPVLQAPNASEPFTRIFIEGLLCGNAERAEQAALGIAELVEYSSARCLGGTAVKFAGPLIRVMSARFPWQVKAAVLKALSALLRKASGTIRTFVPQMQSIFVKCIGDSRLLVRKRACLALGALLPLQTRLSGLLNDLLSLGENSVLSGSRTAAYESCSQVFLSGRRLPESSFTSVPVRIAEALSDNEEEVRKAAGRALGSLSSRSADASQYAAVLRLVLLRLDPGCVSQLARLGALNALSEVLLNMKHVHSLRVEHVTRSICVVQKTFSSEAPEVRIACCATGAGVIVALLDGVEETEKRMEHENCILRCICRCAECDSLPSVRVAALQAIEQVILANSAFLRISAGALVSCAAETNNRIRREADRVFRSLFLFGEPRENIELVKQGLGEQGQKFIYSRIVALQNVDP